MLQNCNTMAMITGVPNQQQPGCITINNAIIDMCFNIGKLMATSNYVLNG